MNLDKQITSFLTVELITDCEIVRISADVLRKLAMENIEIALVCNRMQSVASMREYEYRKMILTCNPYSYGRRRNPYQPAKSYCFYLWPGSENL